MVQMMLLITPELCSGCRLCEGACSFQHYRVIQPSRSRITVVKFEDRGLDVPVTCLQCDDAPCVAACPTSALWKNEETGLVEYDPERCIGCKSCITACPFGGVGWDAETNSILKCDWCGGDPQCARICPTGAIKWVRADQADDTKRRMVALRMQEVAQNLMAPKRAGV